MVNNEFGGYDLIARQRRFEAAMAAYGQSLLGPVTAAHAAIRDEFLKARAALLEAKKLQQRRARRERGVVLCGSK